MTLRRVEQRRERRMRIFMGVFIALLMVISGFSIALSGQQGQGSAREYGITFTPDYDNGVYRAKMAGERLFFYYLPSVALQVNASPGIGELMRSSTALILTFDPNMSSQNLQYIDIIRLDLTETLGKPVISAVTREGSSYILPVISCENATAQLPVLSFEAGELPAITAENGCVRLTANNTEFALIRDRLVYEYYDIYQG